MEPNRSSLKSASSRISFLIDLTAALAMIATAGILIFAKFADDVAEGPSSPASPAIPSKSVPIAEPLPSEPQTLASAPVKGSALAPIGIIEYVDFECPACAGFMKTTYSKLVSRYVETGQVRLFVRHFPLPNRQFSRPAAIGAYCAGKQGKFWEVYERVYSLQPRLDHDGLRSVARKVGVELAQWERCVKGDVAADAVDADFEAARALDLRGTPTFLIGIVQIDGRLRSTARLYGAQSFEVFENAIVKAREILWAESKSVAAGRN